MHCAGVERYDGGRCFACDRRLKIARKAECFTIDGQMQWIGIDCWRKIVAAGGDGYQPPKGGPRLFRSKPTTREPQ